MYAVLTKPVDSSSSAAFRILFGLLGFAAVARFVVMGWVGDIYIVPEHHFTYSGFWWVKPWPGLGMYALFGLAALGSLGIALGLWYRASAALFFLSFTYIELIDKTTYLNHYYWVSLVSLLIIFLPLNRRWSIDALRHPGPHAGAVAFGVVWLLRAQVGVVYVFAGIAKINPDWLLNAMPLRIWLNQNSTLPVVGPLLTEPWAAYAMSWTGAAFDLTIVGWLLWRRTRPFAYLVLVVFHVITWVLFPIGMFPWLMMAAALVFFSPRWPSNALEWARSAVRPKAPLADAPPPLAPGTARFTRIALAALAVFALAQVVLPLRHWAYPGNVRWNEDGYRFAWRVLLTEKTGFVLFRVSDPETGQTWLVSPDEHLTPQQVERMSTQPDMILQTAHIVRDDFRERGYEDIEVYVDAFASLNGRERQRFINPGVDLGVIAPSIWSKWWVTPLAASG